MPESAAQQTGYVIRHVPDRLRVESSTFEILTNTCRSLPLLFCMHAACMHVCARKAVNHRVGSFVWVPEQF